VWCKGGLLGWGANVNCFYTECVLKKERFGVVWYRLLGGR